jgi:beta-lactamase regulating signal transducer with metallopeptidase domain
MIDVLTKKELASVLLHEYGHLAGSSSFYKSSNWVYSKLPLLSAFLDSFALDNEEESNADNFAIKTQGTSRYLNSTKKKLKTYFEHTM